MEKYNLNYQDANRVWIDQFGHVSQARDVTGALLYKNDRSQNGWNVDHIKPISKGGNNLLSNLQVLAAKENEAKGDNYHIWYDTKGFRHIQSSRVVGTNKFNS